MRPLKLFYPLMLCLALLALVSLACSLPEMLGQSSSSASEADEEDEAGDVDAEDAEDDDGEEADDEGDDDNGDLEDDVKPEPEDESDAASEPLDIDERQTTFPLSEAAVITASGLVYEDLEIGSGPAARAGDALSVRYTGYLEDGTVIDSNLDSGTPFQFILGSGTVIPGWDEGLVGMRAGGSRVLVIPPELAYGSSGSGDVIPPDETLTFTVSLVEIR